MPELVVKDVAKEFPTRTGPLSVLRDISLTLATGENLCVLGPSGSGKSTLLAILGTLDHPTSGSVTFSGQDPFTLSERRLADFRNQQIGFVFQDHHLLPQCTALENVLIPTLASGSASPTDVQRARQLLEQVGLTDRAEHRPAELSGGERQRVAIARALVRAPQLVLADEPTGNLDRTTAASISQLLLGLQSEYEMMLIVVTHSSQLAAQLERRVELNNGQLVEMA